MSEVRQSEIAAEAWRQRYVRGDCDLAEMEAGVGRALRGECSDAEWIALAHEQRMGERADFGTLLRSVYRGPIRDLP